MRTSTIITLTLIVGATMIGFFLGIAVMTATSTNTGNYCYVKTYQAPDFTNSGGGAWSAYYETKTCQSKPFVPGQ